MKTQDLERLLSEACGDQRGDLKAFAETGDQDALARIHFDGCADCDRVVEKLIELRDGLPPAPAIVRASSPPMSWEAKVFGIGSLICAVGLAGFLAYMIAEPYFRSAAEAASEAERAQARIRFVPMPGYPGTCVAAVQGVGGYGPSYFGAAPCADVRGRFDADEGLVYGLREYSVVRIRDTDTCLAHAPHDGHDFTFACSAGD